MFFGDWTTSQTARGAKKNLPTSAVQLGLALLEPEAVWVPDGVAQSVRLGSFS